MADDPLEGWTEDGLRRLLAATFDIELPENRGDEPEPAFDHMGRPIPGTEEEVDDEDPY